MPPAAIFNSERYGAMTYTIPGLTAGRSYTVTLYFAETYLTAAGQRLFSVSINGTSVLIELRHLRLRRWPEQGHRPDLHRHGQQLSGQVVIAFISGTENPKINGITVAG